MRAPSWAALRASLSMRRQSRLQIDGISVATARAIVIEMTMDRWALPSDRHTLAHIPRTAKAVGYDRIATLPPDATPRLGTAVSTCAVEIRPAPVNAWSFE